MEDVMDFPRWWESKFVCNLGNLSGYLERSVPLWRHLGHEIAWESKVRSFQPDPGSNGKGCKAGSISDPGVLRFMLCLLGGAPGFLNE